MAAYLCIADLVKRWIYTRQGVHKLTRSAGFPEPEIVAGRTKLWYAADIAVYEAAHPEVTSEDAKHNKVKRAGYAARMGKRQGRAGA
jgi:hypothetical protein